jgi:hypothetical protein
MTLTSCSCPREVPKELCTEHEQYTYFKDYGLEYIGRGKKNSFIFLCVRCGRFLKGY